MSEDDQAHRKSSESGGFQIEEVEIDAGDGVRPGTIDKAVTLENVYAIIGLVFGVIIVLAGVALIAFGFTGSVDIAFESGETKGHLATSALGIVLVIIGAAIVYFTKPRIKIKKPAS